MPDLSIIIPARNEIFLQKTIDNILENIEADTEIIPVCDGYWPNPPIVDNPRIALLHYSKSIGQRAATNAGARLSKARYIMKVDAHCAFDKGFDRKLIADCEADWTVIPRMYNLHAFDWVCKCGARIYQGPQPEKCESCEGKEFQKELVWRPRLRHRSDYMRFDAGLIFQYWREYERRPEAKGEITDLMSSIGACWFMRRKRYWELDGSDEKHGSWGQMGTEMACKAWLSGGRHVVNKKTWFAHMFRTQQGFGFPYRMEGGAVEKAREHSRKMWRGKLWPRAVHPLSWLVEKFWMVPGWTDEDLEGLKAHERGEHEATDH